MDHQIQLDALSLMIQHAQHEEQSARAREHDEYCNMNRGHYEPERSYDDQPAEYYGGNGPDYDDGRNYYYRQPTNLYQQPYQACGFPASSQIQGFGFAQQPTNFYQQPYQAFKFPASSQNRGFGFAQQSQYALPLVQPPSLPEVGARLTQSWPAIKQPPLASFGWNAFPQVWQTVNQALLASYGQGACPQPINLPASGGFQPQFFTSVAPGPQLQSTDTQSYRSQYCAPPGHGRVGPGKITQKEASNEPKKSAKKQSQQLSKILRLEGISRPRKRPEPTIEYLQQSQQPLTSLSAPRPLLVVIDLNGTLIHRSKNAGVNFTARPNVEMFLQYLFANHKVLIWSSATRQNVEGICKKLLTKEQLDQVVGIWARDTLRLTPAQYHEHVQVYKQLSWVWDDAEVQEAGRRHHVTWAQDNTILIDDSMEKAASEPFNLIHINEFRNRPEQHKLDVLGILVSFLELLKRQDDVSAFLRTHPFEYDPNHEPFDWNLVNANVDLEVLLTRLKC